jgi:hypothetical protein
VLDHNEPKTVRALPIIVLRVLYEHTQRFKHIGGLKARIRQRYKPFSNDENPGNSSTSAVCRHFFFGDNSSQVTEILNYCARMAPSLATSAYEDLP